MAEQNISVDEAKRACVSNIEQGIKHRFRNSDLVDDGEIVSITPRRVAVAVEAACEIEQLSQVILAELSRRGCVEDLAVRGITIRLRELSTIIISAIGDEMELTSELSYRLRLERDALLPT